MKKLLLLLLCLFVLVLELSAQDFTLNGKPYVVKGLRVYDGNSHKLSNNELQSLSEQGFDYNAWQRLKVYRNIGIMSLTIGLSTELLTSRYDFYDIAHRFALGFIIVGAISLTETYGESRYLLYILNDRARIGLAQNGIGLSLNF
ncbi:MAG: hypothetical protein J6X39_02580 [Bacteroidales bacterium]|nr:hypothetical protein [Bacteroidales bacterium]